MPKNSKFQLKQWKEQQQWQHLLLRTAGLLTLLSRYVWVESDKKGRSGNWNDPPLMLISRVLLSSPPTRSLASCILRCLLRNSIGFLPGNRRLRKYLPIVSERFKAFLARFSSCRNKRRRRCFNNWGRLDKTFPRVFKKCNSCFQTFTAVPDCTRPAWSKTFLGFGFFFEVNQTFTIVSNPCLPNKGGNNELKPPGGGGTPYNGLYGEAPPRKGYLFQASGIWKWRDFTSWSI